MVPFQSFPILIPDLRSLCVHDISILTPVKVNLDLLRVELIEFSIQGILQVFDITIRMQNLPRLDTNLSFT